MCNEDYKSFISNRKRQITNEIKFYNKYIDEKCYTIVASMIDRTFSLAQILREEKVTYMAPILFKRHRCNSVTHKMAIGKDFCDRLELIGCEVKVLDQAIIHSIRNLIDRSTKLFSLIYQLNDKQKEGFGHYDESGSAQFLSYAIEHVDHDNLCKYVIAQYKDWIRDFCKIDNSTKHNSSLKSVINRESWRDEQGNIQIPNLIMPTHYIAEGKNYTALIQILEMDHYIDKCYSFIHHIIDEVYDRLCNNATES